jgi:hypothetical protein
MTPRAELAELVLHLEAAAYAAVPDAAGYVLSWAPPDDVSPWYTIEQLAQLQADLQRLRPVLEAVLGELDDHPDHYHHTTGEER